MTATAFGALAIILIGALLRHLGLLEREHGPALVRIVLYATLPALVFLITARADLEGALLLVPVAGYAIYGILLAGTWVAARLAGASRPLSGAWVLAVSVGNTGFFGLPLIAAAGDGVSVPAAVMYDTLVTGVITFTATPAIAAALGEGSADRLDWGQMLRTLATMPPNWALALGFAVNAAGVDTLPSLLEEPLEILAAGTLPLVMIYAGMMLGTRPLGRLWLVVGAGAAVRLVIAGAIGYGVATALGLSDEVRATVTLMAAMPTAMMSLVWGSEFRTRADFIAGMVLVTTLISTLTLPLLRGLVL